MKIEQKPDERVYPCADCGTLRSKDEGGGVFTVCDECWDKHYKTKQKPADEKELREGLVKLLEEPNISCMDWSLGQCILAGWKTGLADRILAHVRPIIEAEVRRKVFEEIEHGMAGLDMEHPEYYEKQSFNVIPSKLWQALKKEV